MRTTAFRLLWAAVALLLTSCTQPIVDYPSANQDGRVRFLVLHFTDENFRHSLEILTQPSKNPVSSHYLVARAGESGSAPGVLRLVDEAQRAWHAGTSRWQGRDHLNDQSIGIEIVYESRCPREPARLAENSPWDAEARCPYPEYPPDQIDVVIKLCKEIIARHPDIDASRVIGHSDVQPENKTDPGPRFPWRQLSAAGVGAWFDDADVGHYRTYFTAHPPAITLMQEALAAYGYGVDPSGSIDRRTRDVLFSFQSHFLPDHRSGAIDADTAATLFALLAKYRVEELGQLRERRAELPASPHTMQ